jgi:type IV secretory pathway VirD2 relaxase
MIAHLRYVEREGVQRDGSPGILYSADEERVHGRDFLASCSEDRHQFRLILSPEDGDLYDDLKPLVRGFMARMEKDLGTSLRWIAVDHSDTAHPHSHLILRGKDDRGADLIIAREYILKATSERLSEIVTRDLGPRQDYETKRKMRTEISAEKMTSLDRSLELEAGNDRVVWCVNQDPVRHALKVGRLRKLEALGLAEPLGPLRWKLAPDLTGQLTRIEDQRAIIRSMQRVLVASEIERAPAEQVLHGEIPESGLVGRVLERGLLDQQPRHQYLVVDGIDGRAHYVEIADSDRWESIPNNAIVRLRRNPEELAGGFQRPVRPEMLSPLPIEKLGRHNGATWLDERLTSDAPEPCRDAGFGKQVRDAEAIRRQWLCDQNLATGGSTGFALRPDAVGSLKRRELAAVTARLSKELNLEFTALAEGEDVSGILSRRIDLASGRFALIETGHRFSLVPWEPTLGSRFGREVSGVMHATGVRWNLGRARSLGI